MTYGLWGASAPTGIITRDPAVDPGQADEAQAWLDENPNWTEQDNEPDCEHGLSAWLCEGPQHYPMGI